MSLDVANGDSVRLAGARLFAAILALDVRVKNAGISLDRLEKIRTEPINTSPP